MSPRVESRSGGSHACDHQAVSESCPPVPPFRLFVAFATVGVVFIVVGVVTALWLAALGACLLVAAPLGYAVRETKRHPAQPARPGRRGENNFVGGLLSTAGLTDKAAPRRKPTETPPPDVE
jgi:hypothetical protein